MDCHDVSEKVNLLIDGEITDEEKLTLLDHLEKCSDCFHLMEAGEKLKLIIREKFQRKAACKELQQELLHYVESKG